MPPLPSSIRNESQQALVAHYAIGLVHLSLGEPLKDVMTRTFDPADSRMFDRVIVFAAVTTVVPLVEEVYFRGLLVSAVSFGALHGDWIWAAATAALGVLLAYVYWRSGSIWTSIILHASYNGGGYSSAIDHWRQDAEITRREPSPAFRRHRSSFARPR